MRKPAMTLLARLWGCVLFLFPYLVMGAPKVVVTLKPIHALVAGVMEGVGEPTLLLPDRASPHTFQIKPSTLKAINEAELIIWVGPSLENFMVKIVEKTDPAYGVLTLSALPHLHTLPVRQGREWGAHDHDHDHNHSHSHDSPSGNNDPHIWLSIDNAKIIVRAIEQNLSKIDPMHTTQYQNNAKNVINQLHTLQKQLTEQFTPYHTIPFLVYHDGYQYFENEFHLNAKGTLLTNPHLPLSGYGLQAIKKQIASEKIYCVFRETEFTDKMLPNNLTGLPIKIVELDPLGARFPAGPRNYVDTLQALGNDMISCFREAPKAN